MKKIPAAFVAVAVFWLLFFGINRGYWWDEFVYLGLGTHFPSYGINFGQEAHRPPLFPLIISLLLPWGEHAVMLFVIGCGLAACLIAARYAPQGDKAMLLLASFPLFFFFGHRFLSETLGALIALSCVLLFYAAGSNHRLLIFAGPLLALGILVKLQLIVLIPPLLAFTYLKNPTLLASRYAAVGALLFIAFLLPYLIFIQSRFGIAGYLNTHLFEETEGLYGAASRQFFFGGWDFYVRSAPALFGLSALLFIPFLMKRGKSDFELLLFLILTTVVLFFSFVVFRKEARYLLAFAPFFALAFAHGLGTVAKLVHANAAQLTLLFFVANAFMAIQLTAAGAGGGESITAAAHYIRETNASVVVADYYPPIAYLSNAKALRFPEREADLLTLNASYAVAAADVPFTPAYAMHIDGAIAQFGNGRERVLVYKLSKPG